MALTLPWEFYVELQEVFNEGKTETSLVGLMQQVGYEAMAILASISVNRFGCRTTAISGSVLAAVGFTLATFSPSIPLLVVTMGFMEGTGIGVLNLTLFVAVGQYFEERRAMATGLATCGSGIGSFALPPFYEFLIDEYDWKVTCYIGAGIMILCTLFATLYRPVTGPSSVPVVTQGSEEAKDRKFLILHS